MKTIFGKLALILVVSAGVSPLAHADLYYGATNYNGSAFTLGNDQEVGNQVVLGASGLVLTNFTFQYRATTALSSDVAVDVRFYANDGTPFNGYATPGTSLYDSGWFSGGGLSADSAGDTIIYDTNDFGNLVLPSSFTFTITFTNLDADNAVELPLTDPPLEAGSDYADYWLNTGTGWELETNTDGSGSSFIAEFSGPSAVPEPSALPLSAVAGALLMFGGWFRKRNK